MYKYKVISKNGDKIYVNIEGKSPIEIAFHSIYKKDEIYEGYLIEGEGSTHWNEIGLGLFFGFLGRKTFEYDQSGLLDLSQSILLILLASTVIIISSILKYKSDIRILRNRIKSESINKIKFKTTEQAKISHNFYYYGTCIAYLVMISSIANAFFNHKYIFFFGCSILSVWLIMNYKYFPGDKKIFEYELVEDD